MNAQDKKIRAIFYQAMRLCDSHGGGSRLLEESEAIAAKQERQHRAFGRRLVGNIGARASVATCAQYFALKGFLTPARERSYDDRADFVMAYGAATRFRQPENRKAYQAFARKYRAEIMAMDYANNFVARKAA
jgi:hypothetical protein